MIGVLDEMVSSLSAHWFWVSLTLGCLAWYSIITVYVAVKGAADIKAMLRRMSGPRKPSGRETDRE